MTDNARYGFRMTETDILPENDVAGGLLKPPSQAKKRDDLPKYGEGRTEQMYEDPRDAPGA